MQIVTITTDFGLDDHFAGIIKGALLSQHAALNLVDITHNVKKYDIVHAAFILKNTYTHYPEGTIHLINVMVYHEKKSNFIVFQKDGHFFIGPDNGIFPLFFDQIDAVYHLQNKGSGVFAFKDIFAQAVAHIAKGMPFEEIGLLTTEIERRISLQPVISHGQLTGSVLHIDSYGNVILNINRTLFEEICKDRTFSLFFKRHEPITKISKHYADVPIGDLLCLFNYADHLEIALNMDKASEKYSLKVDDSIIIKLD